VVDDGVDRELDLDVEEGVEAGVGWTYALDSSDAACQHQTHDT